MILMKFSTFHVIRELIFLLTRTCPPGPYLIRTNPMHTFIPYVQVHFSVISNFIYVCIFQVASSVQVLLLKLHMHFLFLLFHMSGCLNLLNFINLRIFGGVKISKLTMCNFCHPPLACLLLGQNILLSTLFLNIPNLMRFTCSEGPSFTSI